MARRARPTGNVTPFSRDYRRAPRFGMGLPPHRRPTAWRRLVARVLDPVFYLKAVIGVSAAALLVLPLGADAINAALKPARTADGGCRVLSVIDGDTLSIWCAGRGVERARLTAFDTPEKFSPGCVSELVAAERATWALRLMIFQADTVAIAIEGRDRYDRALVTMRLDGVSVARSMIAAGHARAYDGGQRQGWCGPVPAGAAWLGKAARDAS